MFADLVYVCMKDPNAIRQLCCLPISFESKYYPPAILLIFCLMAGPRIGMILGLIIGYVEAYGYLDRIIMGLNTAILWEQKATLAKCVQVDSFVKAQGEQNSVGFI